jgi:nitrate reductase NapE component
MRSRSDPREPVGPALFQPTRLAKRSLDVQVTSGMRRMGANERNEVLERQQQILDRFELRSPRRMRRLKTFVIGSVVLFPLLTAVVTSLGFGGYVWQVLLAAVYGSVLGVWRLGPGFTAALTMLTGFVTVKVVSGSSLFELSFGSILALALYGIVGFAIGISDDLTRDEE